MQKKMIRWWWPIGHTKLQEIGIAGEEHIRDSNANNLEHGSGPTLVNCPPSPNYYRINQ